MKLFRREVFASLASLLATASVSVANVSAQALTPAPLPSPSPGTSSGAAAGVIALVILGLIALIGFAVKLHDMKRKREDEAAALQGRLSDLLLSDRILSGFALTPSVEVPLRAEGLTTVTLSGAVPTPELRDCAMELVMRSMDARTSFRVVDHVVVDPLLSRRAA